MRSRSSLDAACERGLARLEVENLLVEAVKPFRVARQALGRCVKFVTRRERGRECPAVLSRDELQLRGTRFERHQPAKIKCVGVGERSELAKRLSGLDERLTKARPRRVVGVPVGKPCECPSEL